jgi:hypothetical protein
VNTNVIPAKAGTQVTGRAGTLAIAPRSGDVSRMPACAGILQAGLTNLALEGGAADVEIVDYHLGNL